MNGGEFHTQLSMQQQTVRPVLNILGHVSDGLQVLPSDPSQCTTVVPFEVEIEATPDYLISEL